MKKRRAFSREYKLEAIENVVLQGMSYCEVARDLGWVATVGDVDQPLAICCAACLSENDLSQSPIPCIL